MGNKPRAKMPPAERAKQFAPFAALKGLPEALAAKEQRPVPRRELSDTAAEELDRCLHRLHSGQRITVSYYDRGHYRSVTGRLEKLDRCRRLLWIDGVPVLTDDLYSVSPETED